MKHALKKLSELYTRSWLKIHNVDPGDQVFDAETSYQNKLFLLYFLFAGLTAFILFGLALYFEYFGMSVAFIVVSIVAGMGAAYIEHKYQESDDLRKLRVEWARERKIIVLIDGLKSSGSFGYIPDLVSVFETEIRRLYDHYCEKESSGEDLKHAFVVKRRARHIYEIARYCGLGVRGFGELFK